MYTHPVVRFSRRGESGNIFAIMDSVSEELCNVLGRIEGRKVADECFDRVYGCDSYEEALDVISEYVELVAF